MTDITQPRGGFDLKPVLAKVVSGEDLTAFEAEQAFDQFMDGSATPAEMASLLTGLRLKGHVPSEVAGGVRALRKAMVPVASTHPEALLDTCGTGGGSVTTFNISTAAALVAAGAGVRVAKHGNRSFTSRSGSADVLEALGVTIEMEPERMAGVLAEAGIVFMFAPLLHPAMRHVGPVRRELGFTTIMNILGPLTNPAGVSRQVVGVASPELVDLVVHSLAELGHHRALVVHGEPGMDEISPLGPTRGAELNEGEITERIIAPEHFGLASGTPEELAGGGPAENAQIILDVLEGRNLGAARSATLLNAGAAIYIGGRAATLDEGLRSATESIDSGAAYQALERLRKAST
jgi:anthranilate phosphoribosyltransferase